MRNRDKTIIKKMCEEIDVIKRIINGLSETDFLANDEKQRATVMTLINIGELVKNLNQDFRLKHNMIPWKQIAGLRDVAAHGYFILRMDEIWVYACHDLPNIEEQIKEILGNEEEIK